MNRESLAQRNSQKVGRSRLTTVIAVLSVTGAAAWLTAPAAGATGASGVARSSAQPPVAVAQSVDGTVGTPASVDVLLGDTDPNGATLTVSSTTTPADGSVSCGATSGLCTYTPNAAFTGMDAFNYTVSDSLGESATSSVTVTIHPALSAIRTIGGPSHAEIYPSGVDVGLNGDIVVSDLGNDAVKEFSPSGTLLWSTGSYGPGVDQFSHPRDVAIDASGDVWVADAENNRVVKLDANGNWLASYDESTTPNGHLSTPLGVSVADGQLYVADTGNNAVRVLGLNGKQMAFYQSSGTCSFLATRDATADAQGNIYVAGYKSNLVSKLSPSGACVASWGGTGTGNGQMRAPYGIAAGFDPVLGAEAVYVADANNERAEEFTTTGTFVATAGSAGPNGASGTGTMSEERKVAVDPNGTGEIWTADLWGWLVHSYLRTSSGYSFNSDLGQVLPAPTSTATFQEPRGIAFESNGTIDVVDTIHQRIVRMSAQGDLVSYCGLRGSTLGEFNQPHGAAIDPATGRLWVGDTHSYRIEVLNQASVNSTWPEPKACAGAAKFDTEGKAAGQFNWMYSLTIRGSDETSWIADTKNDRIESYSAKTYAPISMFGSLGSHPNQFNLPGGIAVDPGDGNTILVADTGNNRIAELSDTAGSSIVLKRTIAGYSTPDRKYHRFNGPEGVAADADGRIFVADSLNNQVVVLNPDGTFLTIITGFDNPQNLAFDNNGNLVVANTLGDDLMVFAGAGPLGAN